MIEKLDKAWYDDKRLAGTFGVKAGNRYVMWKKGEAMKFLHISDLHIGKRIHEFSMIEDQKYILKQILTVAKTEQAEGILIAGDIYDKPVPSAEAVQVFDRFLTELAEQKIKVFVISGNHDSAERLAFGAQLMQGKDVYVSPVYDGTVTKIQLQDAYGELYVYLLPFVKPSTVRHALNQSGQINPEPLENYQDAMQAVMDCLEVEDTKRNILIAHQFVTGAGRCESEEVVVGGLDNMDAELFDRFDYVALGHIHSPQSVGRETLRYCGTPLKYSFSEANQQKSVTVMECFEKGRIEMHTVPLKPLHDMRKIKGTYLEVTARSFYQEMDTEDYVQITLTDEEDVPDGLQKLRVIYPNLMRLEYDNSRTRQSQTIEAAEKIEQKSELELFEDFYELQNNQPMGEEQRDFVRQLIEDIKEK